MAVQKPIALIGGELKEIPLTDKLPDAIQNLPAGGTTGQVLAKASNTDYAAGWVDPSGSGSGLTQAQVLAINDLGGL